MLTSIFLSLVISWAMVGVVCGIIGFVVEYIHTSKTSWPDEGLSAVDFGVAMVISAIAGFFLIPSLIHFVTEVADGAIFGDDDDEANQNG